MKQPTRGMLIAFEGIDGSGKSTCARALFDHLNEKKLPVVLTKEPGGSPLGKLLRSLLQESPVSRCALAEFFLFCADRAQHFHDVVIPALNNNNLVISDRLADSSLVYQGFGRGLSMDMIASVNQWAMQNNKPDITFYLKVPLDVALERLRVRKGSVTNFERDYQLLQKAVHGFDTLYAQRSDVITIDAQHSVPTVVTHVLDHMSPWLSS